MSPLVLEKCGLFLVRFLPITLLLSYVNGVPNEIGGFMTIGVLVSLAFIFLTIERISLGPRFQLILFIIVIYLVAGAVPGFGMDFAPTVLRDLVRYGLVLFALSFGAAHMLRLHFQLFVNTAVGLCAVLAVVGFAAVVGGGFKLGLLSVTQYHPLRFAGIIIPTTSSIFENTNYYGMTLALAYAMNNFFGVTYIRSSISKAMLNTIFLVGVVLSGSRSVMLGIILVLVYQTLLSMGKKQNQRRILVIVGALMLAAFALVFDIFGTSAGQFLSHGSTYLVNIADDVLVQKGLNKRDALWLHGIDAFNKRPLGYGFGAIGEVMARQGALQSTVQNVFLASLLTGGVPLLLLTVLSILGTLASYFRSLASRGAPNKQRFVRTAIACYGLIVLDSFVRTYFFGGVGMMPFMFSFFTIAGLGGLVNVRQKFPPKDLLRL